jgi:hypothetical protein
VPVRTTIVGVTAGIDTARGRVFPTIVEGHEPSGPDEIVLGTRTLRQLGRRLGQTVEVEAGRSVAMRIVGRSALLTGDAESAATGAILTMEGLQRLDPEPGSGYGAFHIRYAPRGQVSAAVAWQATTVALLALAVGCRSASLSGAGPGACSSTASGWAPDR